MWWEGNGWLTKDGWGMISRVEDKINKEIGCQNNKFECLFVFHPLSLLCTWKGQYSPTRDMSSPFIILILLLERVVHS